MSVHRRSIYYEPSWRGGDQIRPLCRRSECSPAIKYVLTEDDRKVTCVACRAKMAGLPVPKPRPLRKRPTLVIGSPEIKALLDPPKPSMRAIAEEVANQHGYELEEILAARSKQIEACVRHAIMAALHDTGRFTNQQIANLFGLIHHTTVVHGRKRHAERMAQAAAA